jgi:HPt (histidine-containing phosphotransfer) domain-containing protein
MDIRMPDVDGLHATRKIRALPGSRGRVPIVALSADMQPETRSQAMRAGASGFLPKPIDWPAIDLLLARIAADAGRASRAAPAAARVDEASFACARDELGPDAHDLALQHYWQHGASDVDACRAALAADDFGALAAAAHSLAGASASVGIESVAAAASSLEASGAAQAGAALRRLEAAFAAAAADWRMQHP